MIGVGQADMNRAAEAVEVARREVEASRSSIEYYSKQVQHYRSLIDGARSDMAETDDNIQETDSRLCDLSVRRGVAAQIQGKIRRAATQLGELSGHSSVLEAQTRTWILLGPVGKVLEETIKTLGRISADDLLHRRGVTVLMEELQSNHRILNRRYNINDDINAPITLFV